MAQEQVDSIIRALTSSMQLAQETNYRNGVIAQNQAELKAKQDKEKRDREDALEKLRIENEHWQLTHDLAKQLQKVQTFKDTQTITGKAINEGIPTPGFEKKATFKGSDGKEYENWQTPEGIMQVLSQAQRAMEEGQNKLAVEQPTINAKAEQDRKTQEAKDIADAASDRTKSQYQFSQQSALQLQRDNAAKERDRINNAARLNVATLRKMQDKEDINTEPWINGLIDGTFTQEDVIRAFPKDKTTAEFIINSVVQAGHKPLNKDMKEFVEQLSVFKPALDDYKKLIELTPDSSYGITGFIGNTQVSATTKNLAESLNGNKLLVATVLNAQGKRTSDKDAAAGVAQDLPSEAMFGIQGGTNDPKTVLVQKFARLKKQIKNALDTRLKDLSPTQKTIILDKFGLNDALNDSDVSDKDQQLINDYGLGPKKPGR
jgi:hypothetical protein